MELHRLKQLAGLFEDKENLVPHVGLENEENASKACVALIKAGLPLDIEFAMGIFYFNFKTKGEMKKATSAINKVIDKKKESEW